jgi:transcriptional regulator with XRE-family HTH domain
VSGRISAAVRLPSEAWRNPHMLRAWRTYDFRSIFHLACKVGLSPEIIADSTGLPLDLVLNVMKGNTKLSGDSHADESVAAGLGMPEDIRSVVGLPPARPRPAAKAPSASNARRRPPESAPPTVVKLPGAVGERIAELRRERKLTQEQLAERAGISLAMISKLERHGRTPSLAVLDSVAKALDVPPSELISPSPPRGRPGRKSWQPPDYLPADILSRPDFIAACKDRDLGAIFEIAGDAEFSRSHLARRCEMSVSQVSAYMAGARTAKDVGVFGRVSDGLHIPGELLGIGTREWEAAESDAGNGQLPRATRRSAAQEKRELRQGMRAIGMEYRQVAAEFGRTYRLRPRAAWREAYGWTLQETADRINSYCAEAGLDRNGICGMTAAHLCEYENWPGKGDEPIGRRPSPAMLGVLASLYDCQIHDLVDLADRKHYPRADLLIIDNHMRPTPEALRAGERERPTLLRSLITERNITPDDEGAAIAEPSHPLRTRITAADVAAIEDFTQTFRGLDNKFGGGHTHGLAAHYFDSNVVTMLREASYTDEIGQRLSGAAAKLAHLAGWTAYDTESHRAAEFYFRNALELSASIGDIAFSGEILAAKSHHAIHLNRPKDALQLARASANAATAATVPALQAEACVLEANAHAALGDSKACAASLNRAETAFDRVRVENTPDWLLYLDEYYLAARFAHCFRDLKDWRQARTFASKAAGLSGTLTRSRAFNAAVLATTYIETDIDQACHIGKQVLNAAADLQSSRVVSYIGKFHNLLIEHHGTVPVVIEFIEQLNETLGSSK